MNSDRYKLPDDPSGGTGRDHGDWTVIGTWNWAVSMLRRPHSLALDALDALDGMKWTAHDVSGIVLSAAHCPYESLILTLSKTSRASKIEGEASFRLDGRGRGVVQIVQWPRYQRV